MDHFRPILTKASQGASPRLGSGDPEGLDLAGGGERGCLPLPSAFFPFLPPPFLLSP